MLKLVESPASTHHHSTQEEMVTRCASELILMVMALEKEHIFQFSLFQ